MFVCFLRMLRSRAISQLQIRLISKVDQHKIIFQYYKYLNNIHIPVKWNPVPRERPGYQISRQPGQAGGAASAVAVASVIVLPCWICLHLPHHQVGPGFPQSASLLQAPSSQSTTAVDHWFSILISLHADIQFDQCHLLKRLSFFQTVFLAS